MLAEGQGKGGYWREEVLMTQAERARGLCGQHNDAAHVEEILDSKKDGVVSGVPVLRALLRAARSCGGPGDRNGQCILHVYGIR